MTSCMPSSRPATSIAASSPSSLSSAARRLTLTTVSASGSSACSRRKASTSATPGAFWTTSTGGSMTATACAARAALVVGDLLGPDHQRHVERQERGDGHRHDGGHGGHAVEHARAPVGLQRGRPLVAVHDVDPALAHELPQRAHHLRRRPAAGRGRGDELEARARATRVHQPAGLAEDDDLVAEAGDGRAELDRVELAAADLHPVRVDDDLHADSRISSGSGAGPASAAGEPSHLRSAGTSRRTHGAHADERPRPDAWCPRAGTRPAPM